MEDDTLQAAHQIRVVPNPATELENLFRAHYDKVFKAAYRVTGSAVDAEDVLQTVFFRLAKRKETLDLSPNPEGYLVRSAVNAGLDLIRSRTRTGAVELDDVMLNSVQSTARNPEIEQVDRELRDLLKRAVAKLGPKSAEIFTLRYFQGFSNQEIGEMLGTSHAVIAVLLHRSRSKLRKEIGSYLEKYHEA